MSEEYSLTNYTTAIRRRWYVPVTAAVLAAAIGLGVSYYFTPRQYRSETTIISTGKTALGESAVLMRLGLPADIASSVPGLGSDAGMLVQLLRSRTIRESVVEKCGLQEFLNEPQAARAVDDLAEMVRAENVQGQLVRITVTLQGTPQGRGGDDLPTREMAASIADQHVTSLRELMDTFRLSSAKRRRVFLESQKQKAFDDLTAAESELHRWQEANTVVAADKIAELTSQGLVELEKQLEQSRITRQATAEELSRTHALLKTQPEMHVAATQKTTDPAVEKLRGRIVELEENLATELYVKHKTEQHPEVRDLQTRLATAHQSLEAAEAELRLSQVTEQRNRVREELFSAMARLEAQQAAAAARVEGTARALHKAEANVAGLSALEMQYGRLLRQLTVREKVYGALVQEYETALIAEQAEEPGFQIIDTAVVPYKKYAPSLKSAAILGFLMGFILGCALLLAAPGGKANDKGND